jgi:taurine dioxygenase
MAEEIPACELRPFGVEVDVDLSVALAPAEAEAFAALFRRHDLVLVRDQTLGMDEQARVMSYLGPVLRTVDSMGEISRESPIGLGGAALCFHSDYAYSPEPLLGISLHAVDVMEEQTSTRFAGGRTAYASLDRDLCRRLEGRLALQVFGARLDTRNRLAEVADLPSTPHPLVWDHPGSGGHFVFAPEMTTDSVLGLPEAESEELITQVFAALYADSNVLEHRWRRGDLVIWHNVSVVHARGDYSTIDRRVLQRVAIGTKGYYELYPEMAEQMADYGWREDSGTAGS